MSLSGRPTGLSPALPCADPAVGGAVVAADDEEEEVAGSGILGPMRVSIMIKVNFFMGQNLNFRSREVIFLTHGILYKYDHALRE